MFGEAANKVYIEMLKDPEKGDQPYTYGERLHDYLTADKDNMGEWFVTINQMNALRGKLKESITTGVQNNRICGVIWNPCDLDLKDPPCFQWFQCRLTEGNKVSLRILFRSNDASNAVFANMGAVIRVFVDEVIKPAGGELEEVIWTATSEHIYDNDVDQVEAVVGKIPEYMRRRLR
jgi:thymidylate synthase